MRRWLVWMGLAAVVLAAGWGAMAADRPAALQAQATPAALGAGVDAQAFFFDARIDLETLMDSRIGSEVRPEGWTGNLDTESALFAPNLWYDSELMADAVYGAGQRPEGWQGATTSSLEALVRAVRRNIETAADQVFGLATRPQEWRGASPLLRCDRTLLNTLALLELFYRYTRTTPDSAINFCDALQAELELKLNELVFSTPNREGVTLDPIELLGGMRGDLERLADELLGLNNRPTGYFGNRDARTATFVSDAFIDMNALANVRLGSGVRPAGWIGTVAAAPGPAYYTLRYDLELLADATLPEARTQDRPTGWQGQTPSERCQPRVSYLTFLINENYGLSLDELDAEAADYCAQLEEALNALAENPPSQEVLDEVQVAQRYNGISDYAFAYLDVGALQYMGVMPGGTAFRAVSRNFGDSTMMFVVGDQFALYVDQRFTNIEETAFNSLPTIDPAGPVAFCDANWCNGPGPTPTPTGGSPLEQILFGSTPQATPNPDDLSASKQLVSWEYVRVTYISDNLAARSAQVTLELCNAPAAVASTCEPATRVFDNSINAERPAVGQQNGQNVYDFRYGYNTAIVIESESFFSTDVWISDPTIR